jgi:hypothetical protein
LAKHESLNAYDQSEARGAQDFYLGVKQSLIANDNTATTTTTNEENFVAHIYSPLIQIHDKTLFDHNSDPKLNFNTRPLSVSFSYMLNRNWNDTIDLLLISNRSDIAKALIMKSINQNASNSFKFINQFSHFDDQLETKSKTQKMWTMKSDLNECSASSTITIDKKKNTNSILDLPATVGLDDIQISREESKLFIFLFFILETKKKIKSFEENI